MECELFEIKEILIIYLDGYILISKMLKVIGKG